MSHTPGPDVGSTLKVTGLLVAPPLADKEALPPTTPEDSGTKEMACDPGPTATV